MRNKRGFTLIELLVVIAIIALLMSILMPSLKKARLMAMDTICMTRLKSISQSIMAYAADNNDRTQYAWWAANEDGVPFIQAVPAGGFDELSKKIMWHHAAAPYLGDWKVCFCPYAQKPDFKRNGGFGSTFNDAWQVTWGADWVFWENTGPPSDWPRDEENGNVLRRGPASSYAFNDYLADPGGMSAENRRPFWETMYPSQADMVPAVMDGAWYMVTPSDEAWPPVIKDTVVVDVSPADEMNPIMLPRHRDGINIMFMDFSGRRVGLKELWTLKWSRTFDNKNNKFVRANAPWPDWVEDLRE